MREIPNCAVEFVSEHEGCELKSYRDSVGILTIGYGHTGPDVKPGQTITKATALIYLKEDLGTAARRLASKVKAEVIAELTEHQYAALLSFVFNVGAGDWTIWKVLNTRQFDGVPQQLMRFVNGGGKKIQGLVNRRAAEVVLWSTHEPGSTPAEPPSSETRNMPTPPTPEPAKPLVQSKTLWTGGAVAAGGVVQGAQQLQALAAPQAANSEWIAKLAAFAAVLVVAGGVAIMVFKWLDQRARHA